MLGNTGQNTVDRVVPLVGLRSTRAAGCVIGLFAMTTLSLFARLAKADVIYASSDLASGSISRIAPGGVVTTFVSGLPYPTGIAFDPSGNLYVALSMSGQIDKITPAGTVSTFATGLPDGIQGLAFDSNGNLYAANEHLYEITPSGAVSVYAQLPGGNEFGIAVDSSGDLFVSSGTELPNANTLYKVPPPGGTVDYFSEQLDEATGVAFDKLGNLYVANWDLGTIVEFPAGVLSSSRTNTRPSTFASLGAFAPLGLTFDSTGDLFFGGSGYTTLDEILANGTVRTYATGLPGDAAFLADPATAVPEPSGMTLLCVGPLFLFRRPRGHGKVGSEPC